MTALPRLGSIARGHAAGFLLAAAATSIVTTTALVSDAVSPATAATCVGVTATYATWVGLRRVLGPATSWAAIVVLFVVVGAATAAVLPDCAALGSPGVRCEAPQLASAAMLAGWVPAAAMLFGWLPLRVALALFLGTRRVLATPRGRALLTRTGFLAPTGRSKS